MYFVVFAGDYEAYSKSGGYFKPEWEKLFMSQIKEANFGVLINEMENLNVEFICRFRTC